MGLVGVADLIAGDVDRRSTVVDRRDSESLIVGRVSATGLADPDRGSLRSEVDADEAILEGRTADGVVTAEPLDAIRAWVDQPEVACNQDHVVNRVCFGGSEVNRDRTEANIFNQ
jgi:hypothetical protein